MSSDNLYFLSWLQRGLATAIGDSADTDGTPTVPNAAALVSLELTGGVRVQNRQIVLRGPDAVTGIDSAQIIRQEPKPGTSNAEPNYFPFVELASPHLPWLFTPAAPNGDRLRPWLVLVVLKRSDATISAESGRPRPILTIETDAGNKLPPLAESYGWAHVQSAHDVSSASILASKLRNEPQSLIARLICPVRLLPFTDYVACLVPAFRSGAQRGLGLPVDTTTIANAWETDSDGLQLPVYHSWTFSTGEAGDFEALAERLEGVTVDDNTGLKKLDLSQAGPGLPAANPTQFAGALVSANAKRRPWFITGNNAFIEELRTAVNSHIVDEEPPVGGYNALEHDPVVAPPLYGSFQGGVDHIIGPRLQGRPRPGGRQTEPLLTQPPRWAGDLNLDPAQRTVAGLGVRLVRKKQEDLMAEAWQVAANVRRVNQLLARSRQALVVNRSLRTRLDTIEDDGGWLQWTRLTHKRLKPTGSQETVYRTLRLDATLPNGVVSTTLRRQARTAGLVARTLTQSPAAESVSQPVNRLTNRYIAASPEDKLLTLHRRIEPSGIVKIDTNATNWQDAGDDPPNRNTPPQLEDIRRRRIEGPVRKRVSALSSATASTNLTQVADAVRITLDPQAAITQNLYQRVPQLEHFSQAMPRATPVIKQVWVSPEFDDPTYEWLRDVSPELLLPGFGAIPDDSVSLLAPNPAFVEAFLLGLNHEMSREFLWREYPARLNGTWFRHFWDRPDVSADIEPIQRWKDDSHLGEHNTAGVGLVMLIKGELVRRYPNLLLYAEKALPAKAVDIVRNGKRVRQTTRQGDGTPILPLFRGDLGDGTLFAAFALQPEQAVTTGRSEGYFFVLQENVVESRFGLDVAQQGDFGRNPNKPDDLSWGHLVNNANALDRLTHARLRQRLDGVTIGSDVWGSDAASMARLTYQRPMRVLIHADKLL